MFTHEPRQIIEITNAKSVHPYVVGMSINLWSLPR